MIDWITTNWTDVFTLISYVIAGASIVVALTPTKVDDAWLEKILKLFEVVALNKTPVSKISKV